MTAWGGSSRIRRFGSEEAWRRDLYVVMVAVFVSFTGFTFVIPFLPLYINQLGVTDPGEAALWAGVIFGVSPLLAGVLSPVWAILAERRGRKMMMQRALGAFVVLLVAMAFVTNVYQLLVLRLLIGVFGGFGAMSMAIASTLAPRQKVGEAVGLLQATQLSSGIAAPFLGGLVADSFGLRNSFYLASALCLAGFVLISVAYHETPEEQRGAPAAPPRSSLRAYLHLPVFVGLLVTVFTIQFIDRSFGPLLPLYLATLAAPAGRIGSVTGLVMTLGALTSTVAAAGTGKLSSRFAPRPLLLGSLVAGAVLCLPIAFASHWGQVLVLRALLGLFGGGALTLAYAVGGRVMPGDARVGAFGTLAGVGMIGGAVSPLVTGVLSRYASLGTIFVVDTVLYLIVLAWTWRMLASRTGPPSLPLPSSLPNAPMSDTTTTTTTKTSLAAGND